MEKNPLGSERLHQRCPLCSPGCASHEDLGSPRRSLQGKSRSAPVFLSRHLPRTDIPGLKGRIQLRSIRAPAVSTDITSPGMKCSHRLLLALQCRSGPNMRAGGSCPRAGWHRDSSRDSVSPGSVAPGPTFQLENATTAAAAPRTSLWGLCLPLPMELPRLTWPSPAPCSPSTAPPQPSPTVTPRCCQGWVLALADPYLIPVLATEQP